MSKGFLPTFGDVFPSSPNNLLSDVYWREGGMRGLRSCSEGEAYGPCGVVVPRWPPPPSRDVVPVRDGRPAHGASPPLTRTFAPPPPPAFPPAHPEALYPPPC